MVTFHFSKGLQQLEEALDILQGSLCAAGFSSKAAYQVILAAEEVYCNIASYAYQDGLGLIELSYQIEVDPLAITIQFKDSGVPFNPLKLELPDVSQDFEERRIGGLGWFLVTENMDEVDYSYVNHSNVLTLKKFA